MTKKNNNIDNLFSDKLFDYQEDVPNYVFENIQNSLNINAGKTDIDNLFSDNLEDYQEEVPDYVFEEDYSLESSKEHAQYMWANKHLKAVPKMAKDSDGNEVESFSGVADGFDPLDPTDYKAKDKGTLFYMVRSYDANKVANSMQRIGAVAGSAAGIVGRALEEIALKAK